MRKNWVLGRKSRKWCNIVRHTRKNIYYHELIGLETEIIEYPDRKLVGLKGRVLDETLKTLLIETPDRRIIRVFKEHGVFRFITPHKVRVIVKGVKIIGRPEDRLKKISR